MTVETLSRFLAELSKPIGLLGGDRITPASLTELSAALKPFAALPLPDFVAFLHKAENYSKAGTVVVDPPGVAELRQAVEAVHGAAQDAQRHHELDAHQDRLAEALSTLGEGVGLKIAKPKKDAKWIEAHKSRIATETANKQLRELAGRITSVEDLTQDAITHEIESLAQLPPTVLKSVAVAAGVDAATKKKARELVLAALAVLTQLPLDVKPPKAKVAKVKTQADDATILQITSELKEMAVRATNPEAVSDEEIETMLKKVEASGFSDAQMKEVALAVTGVKEKTKKAALLALRGKLTAAKRGLEGQKA